MPPAPACVVTAALHHARQLRREWARVAERHHELQRWLQTLQQAGLHQQQESQQPYLGLPRQEGVGAATQGAATPTPTPTPTLGLRTPGRTGGRRSLARSGGSRGARSGGKYSLGGTATHGCACSLQPCAMQPATRRDAACNPARCRLQPSRTTTTTLRANTAL